MDGFDTWNELKKTIAARDPEPNTFPQEGEVWMSNLGKNIGREQDGKGNGFSRPVLVIKKFNEHMFWVVPLSSKQKGLKFYFNFIDQRREKASAILAQMKLLSVKRFERRMYIMETAIFKEVVLKLISSLQETL